MKLSILQFSFKLDSWDTKQRTNNAKINSQTTYNNSQKVLFYSKNVKMDISRGLKFQVSRFKIDEKIPKPIKVTALHFPKNARTLLKQIQSKSRKSL